MCKMPISLAFAMALWCGPWAQAAERAVVVFDFEFVDTSLQGATYGASVEEQERLAWAGGELRKRLAQTGRFVVLDIAPLAAKVHAADLQSCGGCDAQWARELGAKFAITGWVQKVSNLILNMNIAVRDADTGKLVAGMSVDMRGNTQESWSRALNYLVVNRLLAPGGL
jgi:Protein of unknown function (DUF2380)